MGLPNQCQFLCLAFILTVGALASQAAARTLQEASIRAHHEAWATRHGRVYSDEDEKEARFRTFKENLAFIESWNSDPNKTFQLDINHLADLTNEEFRASKNKYMPRSSLTTTTSFTTSFLHENVSLAQAPAHVDWRKRGAVGPVKSQGQCGCCWAFSAVVALEGITKISTGKLVSLSEQQIIDCNGMKQGCEGGLMNYAFDYVIKNGGLSLERDYPYKGVDDTCNTGKEARRVAKISSHEDVPYNNERALLQAVSKQPVSAAIEAAGQEFQFYKSGVFTAGHCGTTVDHGIAIVGYGTVQKGTDYWLVKNSYGPEWGEEGYIRMQRNVGEHGICGIAIEPSYPIA